MSSHVNSYCEHTVEDNGVNIHVLDEETVGNEKQLHSDSNSHAEEDAGDEYSECLTLFSVESK